MKKLTTPNGDRPLEWLPFRETPEIPDEQIDHLGIALRKPARLAQSSFHWLRLQLCDEFSGIANVATTAPNRHRCPEFSFVWMRSSSQQLVRFARHCSHPPYYPIEWLFCSLSRSHHPRVMDQADIIPHHSADSASTCQRLLAPPSCAGLRRAITGPRAYLTQHLPMGGC